MGAGLGGGSSRWNSDGEGTEARASEGRHWATASSCSGREDAGPALAAAAPRGRAADALSPCAVVIEDDRIDDVLKGMGEKPPSGV